MIKYVSKIRLKPPWREKRTKPPVKKDAQICDHTTIINGKLNTHELKVYSSSDDDPPDSAGGKAEPDPPGGHVTKVTSYNIFKLFILPIANRNKNNCPILNNSNQQSAACSSARCDIKHQPPEELFDTLLNNSNQQSAACSSARCDIKHQPPEELFDTLLNNSNQQSAACSSARCDIKHQPPEELFDTVITYDVSREGDIKHQLPHDQEQQLNVFRFKQKKKHKKKRKTSVHQDQEQQLNLFRFKQKKKHKKKSKTSVHEVQDSQ